MRGLTHASWQACNRGISRYILADLWRLRQRGHCRRLSSTGDRFSRRRARLRPHRGDDGLRGRAYLRCSLQPGFVLGGFASNGYGDLSPGHYNLLSCAVIEILLTFFFVLVIMGVTSAGAPAGFAPLAIGLTLTLIILISIPVTNTSVHSARSTGPAIFAGKAYVDQLWFFWLAPVSGAVVAGLVGGALFREPE